MSSSLLSIPEIIEIGKVSTYLSANYTSKQGLFGGNLIKQTPPVQIAFVTDALEWGYDGGAQTAESLRTVANYLYWLCGKFQLEAQQIISGNGGGSVSPGVITSLPYPLDFEVADSGTFMVTGQSSVTITQYIGYNVEFTRGGITQNTTDLGDGSSFYTWNRTSGLFTISPAAAKTELFRIYPSR